LAADIKNAGRGLWAESSNARARFARPDLRYGADPASLPPYVLRWKGKGFMRHHTVKMRTKKEPFFIGENSLS